jgi:hypothetical protein
VTDCNDTKDCFGVIPPNETSKGNTAGGRTVTQDGQCVERTDGKGYCPPISDPSCNIWSLEQGNENCFIDGIVNEALGIAAATFNVYKLLGVHEQGKLVDAVGQGTAMSNGDLPGFPAANAFNKFTSRWRSIQKGTAILPSAYIGYDFGEIKTVDQSRRVYGIDTSIRKHITAFAIKQSSNPNYRAKRVRLERSDDGKKWYGVGIVTLPDDDCLNTALMRSSVPSRYWRIRPVEFNGGPTDSWEVVALKLYPDYLATNIDNVQDKVFLENRDRDYADEPLVVKASYELVEAQTELSKFGIDVGGLTVTAQIGFSSAVAILGRPLVIGDIVEIPSEAQYSAEMRRILRWMEVTDVTWSTQGYTPGWQPTLLSVTLQPALFTQETQDIFGDLAENEVPDGLGLVDRNDGNDAIFQDYFDASQTAQAEAKDNTPEKGAEGSSTIRQWEQEEIDAAKAQGLPHLQRIGLNAQGLYVEDAMPPNNMPFTEGDSYPEEPSHGDYHRLTYTGLSKDIPARLYRYSSSKGRWIYLETDRRAQYDPDKPTLQEFLVSPTRRNHTDNT